MLHWRRVGGIVVVIGVLAVVLWVAARPRESKRSLAVSPTDATVADVAARHAELARRIKEAITQGPSRAAKTSRASTEPRARAEVAPLAAATWRDEYVQHAFKEATPLFKECYANALASLPDLGRGVVNVKIVVTGDSTVGGIIETSEIGSDTALSQNLGFVECVRESIYALRLPPPEGALREELEVPFEFGR